MGKEFNAAKILNEFEERRKHQIYTKNLSILVVKASATHSSATVSSSNVIAYQQTAVNEELSKKVLLSIRQAHYTDPIWKQPTLIRPVLAHLFATKQLSEVLFLQGLTNLQVERDLGNCIETFIVVDDNGELTGDAINFISVFIAHIDTNILKEDCTWNAVVQERLTALLKLLPKEELWVATYDFSTENFSAHSFTEDTLSLFLIHKEDTHYQVPSVRLLDMILLAIGTNPYPSLPVSKEISIEEFVELQIDTQLRPAGFLWNDENSENSMCTRTYYIHNNFETAGGLNWHDDYFHKIVTAGDRKNSALISTYMHLWKDLLILTKLNYTYASWNLHDTLSTHTNHMLKSFYIFKKLNNYSENIAEIADSINDFPQIMEFYQTLAATPIWQTLTPYKQYIAIYILQSLSVLKLDSDTLTTFLTNLTNKDDSVFEFACNTFVKSYDDTGLQLHLSNNVALSRWKLDFSKSIPIREVAFLHVIFNNFIENKHTTLLELNLGNPYLELFNTIKNQNLEECIQELNKFKNRISLLQYLYLAYLAHGESFISQLRQVFQNEPEQYQRETMPLAFFLFQKDFVDFINTENMMKMLQYNYDPKDILPALSALYAKDPNCLENLEAIFTAPEKEHVDFYTDYIKMCLFRFFLENQKPFSLITLIKVYNLLSFLLWNEDVEYLFPKNLWNNFCIFLSVDNLPDQSFLPQIQAALTAFTRIKIPLVMGISFFDFLKKQATEIRPHLKQEIFNIVTNTKNALSPGIANNEKHHYLSHYLDELKMQPQFQPKSN